MLLKLFFIYQLRLTVLLALFCGGATWAKEEAKVEKHAEKPPTGEAAAGPTKEKDEPKNEDAEMAAAAKDAGKDAPANVPEKEEEVVEDEAAAEAAEAEAAAVARPVSADMVQIYGWRESILIEGMKNAVTAKLDTGAYTSSIHAEEKELFERDGKKWLRFIVTEPREKDSPRVRIEAPLVRIARIKEPGGESTTREVVRLAFKIGERKLRGEFNLNNRANMLAPVLIGRTTIRELGWIDSSRTNLADEKILR